MNNKKIDFDVKYRPEIESGKYKVVTKYGDPVIITDWDYKNTYKILGHIDFGDLMFPMLFDKEGNAHHPLTVNNNMYHADLEIITDEVNFDPFELKLKEIVDSYNDGGKITDEGVAYYAKQLREILKDKAFQ